MIIYANLNTDELNDQPYVSSAITNLRVPRGSQIPLVVRFIRDNSVIDPEVTIASIATSSIATASVITTTDPHGFETGDVVVISGHTDSDPGDGDVPVYAPSTISGSYTITRLSPTTFSIPFTASVTGISGTATRTVELDLRWTVKTTGKYDEDPPLAELTAFVKTGSGDTTTFTGKVNYITDGLNTLLGINPPDTSNDATEVECMAEISWGGSNPGKCNWIKHTVRNDLYKGDEVQPSYPALSDAAKRVISNRFELTGYIGGGSTKLDGLAITASDIGRVFAMVEGGYQSQWRVYAGTDAESVTAGIVRPDNYNSVTNAVVFKRVSVQRCLIAATYYVELTGDDSSAEPGNPSRPYLTAQAAFNAAYAAGLGRLHFGFGSFGPLLAVNGIPYSITFAGFSRVASSITHITIGASSSVPGITSHIYSDKSIYLAIITTYGATSFHNAYLGAVEGLGITGADGTGASATATPELRFYDCEAIGAVTQTPGNGGTGATGGDGTDVTPSGDGGTGGIGGNGGNVFAENSALLSISNHDGGDGGVGGSPGADLGGGSGALGGGGPAGGVGTVEVRTCSVGSITTGNLTISYTRWGALVYDTILEGTLAVSGNASSNLQDI